MSTLFVAWQAPDPTRAWFPIGRLDASTDRREYMFRYTHGALRAEAAAGFKPLIAFPDFSRKYQADDLFPLFKNRILEPNRKDFAEYLRWLDLDPAHADPIEILGLTGGERQTDSLEVFPKVRKLADGTIRCRFFLHGLRHVSEAARTRAENLTEGESLQVAIEVNNPATTYAVQLQTTDCHLIGWAPRYLVDDLRAALLEHSTVSATVHRINRMGAPFARRVLVDLCGGVPAAFEPMTSDEYRVVSE
ncbi:MAG: DNA-binding protein [Pseudomonadota bacterium]